MCLYTSPASQPRTQSCQCGNRPSSPLHLASISISQCHIVKFHHPWHPPVSTFLHHIPVTVCLKRFTNTPKRQWKWSSRWLTASEHEFLHIITSTLNRTNRVVRWDTHCPLLENTEGKTGTPLWVYLSMVKVIVHSLNKHSYLKWLLYCGSLRYRNVHSVCRSSTGLRMASMSFDRQFPLHVSPLQSDSVCPRTHGRHFTGNVCCLNISKSPHVGSTADTDTFNEWVKRFGPSCIFCPRCKSLCVTRAPEPNASKTSDGCFFLLKLQSCS